MTSTTDPRYNMNFHPLKALKATFAFTKNKEDTSQVFRIMSALDGGQSEKNFQRFKTTPAGGAVLAEKRSLYEALCDRDYLRQCPEDSLGRAYLDFVSREGLSPEGFQAEIEAADEELSHISEDRIINRMRLRHAHDLWHVMTGYGRDAIGEAALLGFTYAQIRVLGFAYLGTVVSLNIKGQFSGMPVFACFREGYELGKRAGWLMGADWENLFHLPLEEVRAQFNIGIPAQYLAIADRAAARDLELREELAGAAA
ncbi:Coq4 family protein [Parvularcula sp. IMCC14364]|uniref:Coq4 family protein n=1 Tax=Parvularcula sp. IMCC14364 TaxID=3067902 RepID=UPI002741F88D|nr:Coq4 family protein [Parvularcula sp. IMCC14364]